MPSLDTRSPPASGVATAESPIDSARPGLPLPSATSSLANTYPASSTSALPATTTTNGAFPTTMATPNQSSIQHQSQSHQAHHQQSQLPPSDLPSILPLPSTSSILTALPAAHTFDFLPAIHALMGRILLDPTDPQALQPKDLLGEIAAVKRTIAAAREEVLRLQDVRRSVAEQESEIERVRAKVGALKMLIGELGRDCGGVSGLNGDGDGDVDMEVNGSTR